MADGVWTRIHCSLFWFGKHSYVKGLVFSYKCLDSRRESEGSQYSCNITFALTSTPWFNKFTNDSENGTQCKKLNINTLGFNTETF